MTVLVEYIKQLIVNVSHRVREKHFWAQVARVWAAKADRLDVMVEADSQLGVSQLDLT